MSTSLATTGGGSSTIVEFVSPNVESNTEENATAHESILVAIDTAARENTLLLKEAIINLFNIGEKQGGRKRALLLISTAILIGIKRRNHEKSQAPSHLSGAGEKNCLRTILKTVVLDLKLPECVISILPLLPMYGSWKDLRLLGNELISTYIKDSGNIYSDEVYFDQVINNIIILFSDKMKIDFESLQSLSTDDSFLPSSACKYSPHDGRSCKDEHIKIANEILSDKIAIRLSQSAIKDFKNPSLKSLNYVRMRFRKVRSALNEYLAKHSALLEPLLCSKQLNKIDFAKAPKLALTMYKKAILKSTEKDRWLQAMKTNPSAIPDAKDIINLINMITENEGLLVAFEGEEDKFETEVQTNRTVIHLSISKVISTISKEFNELVKKYTTLLDALEEDKRDFVLCPIGLIVDTSSCISNNDRMSLVLAAFILAKVQNQNIIAIDGELVTIPAVENEEDSTLAWRSLVPGANAAVESHQDKIHESIQKLLHSEVTVDSPNLDVLIFSRNFTMEDPDSFANMIQSVQSSSHNTSKLLRVARVHNLKRSSDCAYVPRKIVNREIPQNAGDLTVDVCFILDCTGSMGSYIDQCKQHVLRIMDMLRDETSVKSTRVAFVAYRDYRDAGRIESADFKLSSNAQTVIDLINAQQASGGDDMPEDMLSAITRANTLNWSSHIRIAVIITDAEAHGYYYDFPGGDNHKSGRCPDQVAPHLDLKESVLHLKHNIGCDILYCKIHDGSKNTMGMIQEQYNDGGFGVISLDEGAHAFADKILSGISTVILKTIAPINVSGLQTADGITISSITSSFATSIRESILQHGNVIKEEVAPSLSDYERLKRDLELDELAPARVALGLDGTETLAIQASIALLNLGLTATQLREMGYPEDIIAKLNEATSVLSKKL